MASVVRHAVVNGRPPEILTSRPVAAAARAHAGVRLVGRVVLPVQIAPCFENFPFSSFLPFSPPFKEVEINYRDKAEGYWVSRPPPARRAPPPEGAPSNLEPRSVFRPLPPRLLHLRQHAAMVGARFDVLPSRHNLPPTTIKS